MSVSHDGKQWEEAKEDEYGASSSLPSSTKIDNIEMRIVKCGEDTLVFISESEDRQ